jgi:hypothetical protein
MGWLLEPILRLESIVFWPFKSRSATERCPTVGQYRIDMTIDGLEGLTPLSPEELVALNSTFAFEGEQIWHAPDAQFMDLRWDTILGTVHGSIYKIAIQLTGPRHETGTTYREMLIYCTKHYGKAENMMLWKASDGNVVVDLTNAGSEGILNVFVTSRMVGQLKRR